MPQAMPLPTLISQASTSTSQYKTIFAQFGDGYSQRASDGINNLEEMWNIVWGNITEAQLTTIKDAFAAVEGTDYLTWTAPGDTAEKKWVISGSIGVQSLSGDIYGLTAEVKRVYDI